MLTRLLFHCVSRSVQQATRRSLNFIKSPSYFPKTVTCFSSDSLTYHSISTTHFQPAMYVKIIPALQDNYMYLLVSEETKEAAIVDPVEPKKVFSVVKSEGVTLTTVLTTHHHWDHAGGNIELTSLIPGLTVCGNDDRIGALNQMVKSNDKIKVGDLSITAFETPCHTTGHICYYVESEDKSSKVVFTGDTLFVGGCGRFFEGTAEQMYHALCEVLATLPPETQVYCGHEYTLKNLAYAIHVEPGSQPIIEKTAWSQAKRDNNEPTIPSTIAEELTYNPFMRVSKPSVQAHAKTSDPISTMAFLREEKNSFKPKM